MTRSYELRLADRRVVVWDGTSGEDAARRYVDAHPGVAVLAVRFAERTGLHIGLKPIVEPDERPVPHATVRGRH